MRPDMFKVIVERPRVSDSARRPGREWFRERQDPEFAPTVESMRRRRHDKTLNENLAPLYRFLRKNVGRPWNKVRSEIAEHVRPTSAVQAHVLQHLRDFVEEHPVMVDGAPHCIAYGGLRPLVVGGGRYRSLYVDPKTGILRIAEKPRRKKPRHPPAEARDTGRPRRR